MSDTDTHLKRLKEYLVQEEEVLSAISDTHNHAEVRGRVEKAKAEIKELEEWLEKQGRIRMGLT